MNPGEYTGIYMHSRDMISTLIIDIYVHDYVWDPVGCWLVDRYFFLLDRLYILQDRVLKV